MLAAWRRLSCARDFLAAAAFRRKSVRTLQTWVTRLVTGRPHFGQSRVTRAPILVLPGRRPIRVMQTCVSGLEYRLPHRPQRISETLILALMITSCRYRGNSAVTAADQARCTSLLPPGL